MDAVLEANPSELGQRQLLSALRAFRRGDFSVRLPTDLSAVNGEIAETFNDIIELNEDLAKELARMRRSVGRDGRIRSEEHTSELQSLMRISYAVFCLKKKK